MISWSAGTPLLRLRIIHKKTIIGIIKITHDSCAPNDDKYQPPVSK